MDPELTKKTELVDKDIKRVIIIAVFPYVQEARGKTEYIK